MLEMVLRRHPTTPAGATLGDLSLGGRWFCYTLEDAIRPPWEKKAGATAVPMGWYQVQITFSPRFKVRMPMIDVDPRFFTGIRIHVGNDIKDTDGCLLVGMTKGVNNVYNSRVAYDRLFAALEAAGGVGHIRIFDPS